MDIYVNGEKTSCDPRTTLEILVENLGYVKDRIAVEVNGEIVPKAEYSSRVLNPSDKLEVVTFVGGG